MNKPYSRMLFIMLTVILLLRSVAAQEHSAQLVVQLGHTSQVTSAAFFPDAAYVVTGGEDGKAILWETATGLQLRTFEGHSKAVYAVAYSPIGPTVVTGSRDGTIRVWDPVNGQERDRFDVGKDLRGAVRAVDISTDGQWVLGSSYNKIDIWNIHTRQHEQLHFDDVGTIYSAVFSRDARSIAFAGTVDDVATLVDRSSGNVQQRFPGAGGIDIVAISPDQRVLLTAGNDDTVRLWDIRTGKETRQYQWPRIVQDELTDPADDSGMPNHIKSLAFSHDGRSIAVGGSDGKARLYFQEKSEAYEVLDSKELFDVPSVAFSQDGSRVLTANYDKAARVWNVSTQSVEQRLGGTSSPLLHVSMPSNGTVITSSYDTTYRVWDLTKGSESASGRPGDLFGSMNTLSANGQDFLSLSGDSITHWNMQSGARELRWAIYSPDKEAQQRKGLHTDFHIRSLVISGLGNVAGTTSEKDKQVLLWDVRSGARLQALNTGFADPVFELSPDAKVVVTAGRNTGGDFSPDDRVEISLWDATSGQKELVAYEPWDHPVIGLEVSPDGTKVAVLFHDEVKVLSIRDLNEQDIYRYPNCTITATSFTAREGLLLGCSQGIALLYHGSPQAQPTLLEGHHGSITTVAASPDESVIATGSSDGTVIVYRGSDPIQHVSLISFPKGGWAIVDDEGHFDASDLDEGAPLHWVLSDGPMHALPLEIFMRDNYTPGLLTRMLRGEKLAAPLSIAAVANRAQPEVKVTSIKASSTPGRVDVVVHAASHKDENEYASGLQDLRLFRDGQLVAGGYREGPLKDGDFLFHDVMLNSTAKVVNFSAYAFSTERIKSSTASQEYAVPSESRATGKPKAYLFQVGVNHYAALNCDLHYSVDDALTMHTMLSIRLAAQGYEVVDIQPLISNSSSDTESAGKNAIHTALASIASRATPDDVFMMSFSGHGYSGVNGAFYILPSSVHGDCHHVDDTLIASTISADELADWLRPIDAKQMTLILDACYSAESIQAGDFKPGPMGSRGLGQVAYDKRMRVLAASQSDEVAHEYDYLQQGLLTYVLTRDGLELKKADWKPIDQKITVGEWLSYAVHAVPQFVPPNQAGTAGRAAVRRYGQSSLKTSLQVPALFDFSRSDSFVLQ